MFIHNITDFKHEQFLAFDVFDSAILQKNGFTYIAREHGKCIYLRTPNLVQFCKDRGIEGGEVDW